MFKLICFYGMYNSAEEKDTDGENTDEAADTDPSQEEDTAIANDMPERAPEEEWDTSIDIVAIIPNVGVYGVSNINESLYYDDYVCECITADGVGENSYVYANIVSISPELTVGDRLKYRDVAQFVCRCTTDAGLEVWVVFSAEDYCEYIDGEVDLVGNFVPYVIKPDRRDAQLAE